MLFKKVALPLLTLMSLNITSVSANYATHPDVDSFVKTMESEGFSQTETLAILSQANRRDDILDLISRPAEGVMTWERYRKIFIEDKRVDQAVEFYAQHKDALSEAELKYGVPKEIILSIMAVETRMGRVTGKHRVLDALSTLAFDYPKRSKYFTKELKNYLVLTRQESIDPTTLKGSYAGASSIAQFMPSSFLAYAVDFNNDGKRDIWNTPKDAIGSIANYFKSHGWKKGEPVLADFTYTGDNLESLVSNSLKPKLTLGEFRHQGLNAKVSLDDSSMATLMTMDDKYQLGLHNFYVISRYNHSKLYSTAVYELSQLIKERI